jgi:predicted DNA-binding transcriptional regulator AlpA
MKQCTLHFVLSLHSSLDHPPPRSFLANIISLISCLDNLHISLHPLLFMNISRRLSLSSQQPFFLRGKESEASSTSTTAQSGSGSVENLLDPQETESRHGNYHSTYNAFVDLEVTEEGSENAAARVCQKRRELLQTRSIPNLHSTHSQRTTIYQPGRYDTLPRDSCLGPRRVTFKEEPIESLPKRRSERFQHAQRRSRRPTERIVENDSCPFATVPDDADNILDRLPSQFSLRVGESV